MDDQNRKISSTNIFTDIISFDSYSSCTATKITSNDYIPYLNFFSVVDKIIDGDRLGRSDLLFVVNLELILINL